MNNNIFQNNIIWVLVVLIIVLYFIKKKDREYYGTEEPAPVAVEYGWNPTESVSHDGGNTYKYHSWINVNGHSKSPIEGVQCNGTYIGTDLNMYTSKCVKSCANNNNCKYFSINNSTCDYYENCNVKKTSASNKSSQKVYKVN